MERLRAGLRVTARAADGTVEGVELPGLPGWFTPVAAEAHTAYEDPAQQCLFDALRASPPETGPPSEPES